MLENKYVKEYDCHYSRFIASWRNSGGKYACEFKRWLQENFDLLTDRDIENMYEMMTCGKLEMEVSAKKFLETNKCNLRSDGNCDYFSCTLD